MKKRYFSLLFITALLCIGLVGCGGNAGPEKTNSTGMDNTPEAFLAAFEFAYNSYDDALMAELCSDEFIDENWGQDEYEGFARLIHDRFRVGAPEWDEIKIRIHSIKDVDETQYSALVELENEWAMEENVKVKETFPIYLNLKKSNEKWTLAGLGDIGSYYTDSMMVFHINKDCPEFEINLEGPGSLGNWPRREDVIGFEYKPCKECATPLKNSGVYEKPSPVDKAKSEAAIHKYLLESFEKAYNTYDSQLMGSLLSDRLRDAYLSISTEEDLAQEFHTSFEWGGTEHFDKIKVIDYGPAEEWDDEVTYYTEVESEGKTFPVAFVMTDTDAGWLIDIVSSGDGYITDDGEMMFHTTNSCSALSRLGDWNIAQFRQHALDAGYKPCDTCL